MNTDHWLDQIIRILDYLHETTSNINNIFR